MKETKLLRASCEQILKSGPAVIGRYSHSVVNRRNKSKVDAGGVSSVLKVPLLELSTFIYHLLSIHTKYFE